MDDPVPAAAPRLLPWAGLGAAFGLLATASVGVFALLVDDADQPGVPGLVAVLVSPPVLGAVTGLGVGLFIRFSHAAWAWRPRVPHPLGVDVSGNGQGPARDGEPPQRKDGAIFGIVGAGIALLGPVFVPILPAPMVLGVGALALDERPWVRVAGATALFVALSFVFGLPVAAWLDPENGSPVALVAGIVFAAVGTLFTTRRIRPQGAH